MRHKAKIWSLGVLGFYREKDTSNYYGTLNVDDNFRAVNTSTVLIYRFYFELTPRFYAVQQTDGGNHKKINWRCVFFTNVYFSTHSVIGYSIFLRQHI